MEQFLQDLESSLGVPAELLERAAEARAEATGSSAENVVRSWAGVGDADAAAPPEPVAASEPAAPTPAAATPAPAVASPAAPAAPPAAQAAEAPQDLLSDLESSLEVPAELLERAAEARAEATGSSAENVVRSWAGVGEATPAATAESVAPPEPAAAPTPAPEPAAAAPTAAAPAPAATQPAGAPEELLADLEASLEVPVVLLERAASARAAVSGASAENIVRSWAGLGDAPAAAAPAAAPAAPAAQPAAAPAAAEPAPAAATAAPGLGVEVLEATEPVPEPDEPDVAAEDSVGVLAGFPGWLSAALLAIPILALSYVLIAPNGPGCGTSGQLAIDAETGLAENCDGTEYGVDATSFFTIGADVYAGAGKCAGCHGDDGGGGTGPAFTGGAVLVTFPGGSCAEHIAWVEIGTDDWPEATYGANNTPVGGASASMPGYLEELSPEDLAAVVIYERVAFGGQSLADAEADCGTAELEVAGG